MGLREIPATRSQIMGTKQWIARFPSNEDQTVAGRYCLSVKWACERAKGTRPESHAISQLTATRYEIRAANSCWQPKACENSQQRSEIRAANSWACQKSQRISEIRAQNSGLLEIRKPNSCRCCAGVSMEAGCVGKRTAPAG
ncbi:hypothetical protein Adt_15436 [Abeliophyllum distichum]|uniref:Uncharacterized protein n=1 Tax=Abeliophyllum distichum TaxID=126358 RepID=A0ABD1U2G6_9LAMI